MFPNETRLALNNQLLKFQLNVIYDLLSTSEHNEVQIDTNGYNYYNCYNDYSIFIRRGRNGQIGSGKAILKQIVAEMKYFTIIIHQVFILNVFWKYWAQKPEMIGL